MRVDLLRHGVTEATGYYHGRTDVPLAKTGEWQMRAATQRPRWSRVVSSPLRRCAVFAEHFAAECNLPFVLDERWREMDFGTWEGVCVADLDARQPEALGRFWRDPLHNPPPESEPLPELRTRVMSALTELLASGDDEDQPLVVAHGGPIRILLAEARGVPLRRLLEIDVPYAGLFSINARLDESGALRLSEVSV
jgi:alpha-ribazole phosphatase